MKMDYHAVTVEVTPEMIEGWDREAIGTKQLPSDVRGEGAELLTFEQLKTIPRSAYIVKNLIGSRDVGLMYGSSMAGKTFLAIDLLWHIANGKDWYGYRIKTPSPVVYFALEGKGGITKRVTALERKYGKASMDNFLFMVKTIDLTDTLQVEAWAKAINDRGLINPIVAIDTVAQASVGIDENTSGGMGMIIAGAQRLAQLIGGTVILVHHTGKDASRGARGWSGLKGAMDFQIEVSAEDSGVRKWVADKVKDGESGKAHQFALEVVELDPDEDGDPVTTCLIKQAPVYQSDKPSDKQIQDQVLRFIASKIEMNTYPTQRSIRKELTDSGVTQAAQTNAIEVLKSELRLEERETPRAVGSKGGKSKYLHPL